MKKFISAIVSLVLAGSTAFGLAACNFGASDGKVSAEEWAEAFESFDELDNFTVTDNSKLLGGIKYNGEYITEDTLIGGVGATGADLLAMLDMDENPEEQVQSRTYKYDYVRGMVEEESYYGNGLSNYVHTDGTTINRYSVYRDGTYMNYVYTGYNSNEQAIAAVRQQNKYQTPFDEEYVGTGENADKRGTVAELFDLFDYDKKSDTYTAVLISEYMEQVKAPVDGYTVTVKMENGIVTSFEMNISIENYSLAEYMLSVSGGAVPEEYLAMFEGITIDITVNESMVLSDIGSTVVTLPQDIKELTEDTYTRYMIDEESYKSAFDSFLGEDGTVSFYISYYDDENGIGYSYTYDFNEELGLLKVATEEYDYYYARETKSTTLYWAKDGQLKTYTAVYEDRTYFAGWSDEVQTEVISGDQKAALIAKLPVEVQLYFNVNGKPLSESYGEFEVRDYTDLIAKVTVNGKEAELRLDYYYSEYSDGGYVLYSYSCGDTDVRIRSGNIIGSYEGLPDGIYDTP